MKPQFIKVTEYFMTELNNLGYKVFYGLQGSSNESLSFIIDDQTETITPETKCGDAVVHTTRIEVLRRRNKVGNTSSQDYEQALEDLTTLYENININNTIISEKSINFDAITNNADNEIINNVAVTINLKIEENE